MANIITVRFLIVVEGYLMAFQPLSANIDLADVGCFQTH